MLFLDARQTAIWMVWAMAMWYLLDLDALLQIVAAQEQCGLQVIFIFGAWHIV